MYVDEGRYEVTKHEYYARLEPQISIIPDTKNPTAQGKTMKSGYGINQTIKNIVKSNDFHNITPLQSGILMFPDFYYKSYYRVLDLTENTKTKSTLEFKNNRFSTYNRRTHFTPIWYPDYADYDVYSYVFDLWTPGGMLTSNLRDGVYIKGNLWQDWTVRPLPTE